MENMMEEEGVTIEEALNQSNPLTNQNSVLNATTIYNSVYYATPLFAQFSRLYKETYPIASDRKHLKRIKKQRDKDCKQAWTTWKASNTTLPQEMILCLQARDLHTQDQRDLNFILYALIYVFEVKKSTIICYSSAMNPCTSFPNFRAWDQHHKSNLSKLDEDQIIALLKYFSKILDNYEISTDFFTEDNGYLQNYLRYLEKCTQINGEDNKTSWLKHVHSNCDNKTIEELMTTMRRIRELTEEERTQRYELLEDCCSTLLQFEWIKNGDLGDFFSSTRTPSVWDATSSSSETKTNSVSSSFLFFSSYMSAFCFFSFSVCVFLFDL